ncbi:MAG: DUF4344 domain-containing metallopeptidase [Kofleriaceae bacterium]
MHSHLVGIVIGLAVAAAATPAQAQVVVVQGVELQLPQGWKIKQQGRTTLLMPQFKGRAIQVIKIKSMPEPTVPSLMAMQKLFGKDKLEIQQAAPLTRDGIKLVAATGKVTSAKGVVSIDVLAVPVNTAAALLISFTNPGQDPMLRQANTDLLLSARVPGPRMTVQFAPPTKPGVRGASREFAQAIGKLAAMLDGQFRLPRPLPVLFKECGQPNAFYSPAAHTITLCHEYFDFRHDLFMKAGMDEAKSQLHSQGAMVFSFMHEFGHALHHELKLPITGRGEDAADEIAAIWLGRLGGKGRQIAALAARAHYENSKLPQHKDVYWDEHSLSMQRVHDILCLLYGADKPTYTPIMKALSVPPQRLAKCVRDYGLKLNAWDTLLAPYKVKKK